MSGEDVPLDEAAVTREKWLVGRLQKARRERDQYRTWFEKLLPAVWAYEKSAPEYSAERDALREEIARIASDYDRVVNARTRGKRRQGEETRRRVLALRDQGKSITETVTITGLAASTVAGIRGKARRG